MQQPECCVFRGYMLARLHNRLFARLLHTLLLLMESRFSFSFSLYVFVSFLLRSAFVPFYFIKHLASSLPSSKLLECKIRLQACMEGGSKQTNSDRREKKSYFFLLSLLLIFSNYAIRSGHISFVSHSLVYIQASTTTTNELYVFLFVSLLSFLFVWSSSSNMRFIYYQRSYS